MMLSGAFGVIETAYRGNHPQPKDDKTGMTAHVEPERIATAYHEAGHAVMGCILGRFPESVTIVPNGKSAVGETRFETDVNVPEFVRHYFDSSPAKQHFVEQRLLTALAGSIANDLKEPGRDHDIGDKRDASRAKEIVIELVSWEDDKDAYLRRARSKATDMLKAHWAWVETVAGALLQRGTLSRAELLELQPRELKQDDA
jgi:ATP-dependent Zn protease